MPPDDTYSQGPNEPEKAQDDGAPAPTDATLKTSPSTPNNTGSIFTVPAPIKALFDRFPLHTYPSNTLPLRAPSLKSRQQHVLYVFTTEQDAARSAPSFNPTCAKWQVFLKIQGVDFATRPSSNHASPSGALPFLLPKDTTGEAVIAGKLEGWARQRHGREKENDTTSEERVRADLTLALLNPIRLAYLRALYLTPAFTSTAQPLYIDSTTNSWLLRAALAYPLRAAAWAEVTSSSNAVHARVDEEALYSEAEEALEALSVTLGDEEWFNGVKPGMVDAGVFGYTHVLLSVLGEGEVSRTSRLVTAVRRWDNLVAHRGRLLERYFA